MTQERAALPWFRLPLAWAALLWEQLWPAFWPVTAAAGIFLAIALFDLLPLLPGWLHAGVLAAFAVAFAVACRRGFAAFAPPGRAAARRRLERSGGPSHRPLTALSDRLAGDVRDVGTWALWRAHQRRMAAAARRLRVVPPAAGLAARDPLALRAAVLLVLIIAVTASWGDGVNRLARAVTPDVTAFGPAPPPVLEIWITPPAYTGLAPVFLKPGGNVGPLSVPEGSTVLAQLHGGRGVPHLSIGAREVAFEAIGEADYQVRVTLETGERLAVVQDGAELAAWPLSVIPDTASTVGFLNPPTAGARGALRLEYEAADDYGVERVRAMIHRAEPRAPATADAAIEIDLPLPALGLRKVEGTSYHDLTPHPWAGLSVAVRLEATDALGQTGVSEAFPIILPEREFSHPVARAIVGERKKLSIDPGQREGVAAALDALAANPQAYSDDIVVFLALTTARARLLYDSGDATIASVQSLLWDTALRIEDGKLSLAERDLRAAQQALLEALARDASDAEIARLMDALQAALDRFLDALTEDLERWAAEGEKIGALDLEAVLLEREDLQRLLDQARELAGAGLRAAARQLLTQLQGLLESLQTGFIELRQLGHGPEGQLLDSLQELIARQQDLLDRTFHQWRQLLSGTPGLAPPDTGDGAVEQEAIRLDLGAFMDRLSGLSDAIPQAFGRSERAMRDAVLALAGNDPGAAVGPQAEALDQLRRGAQAVAQEFLTWLGQAPKRSWRGDDFGLTVGRDPLGRPLPGYGVLDTSDIEIPEERDVQRARIIFEELRRRAGQRYRPEPERAYINRLLRRF
ncbi:MAG: DUF4175 domain-containing protein [Alphaproteobacteria bacterium]